ncbi:DUF2752 domain-containing protein [Reichenbachiella sp.]|uniref:DUF2752 domain-containing protein n=1 Tax=Reichenbachiella sp. TaxID=2184521 RepID=UPI003BAF7FFF
MTGSTILKAFTSLDLTIPCLIKLITHNDCYGCGLTTAATHLLQFQPKLAYEANALVFVILPLLGFLMIKHLRDFIKDQQEQSTNQASA